MTVAMAGSGVTGRLLFPPPGGGGGQETGPFVWDANTARRIPGVGRALGVYCAMLKQAPLDAWRGLTPLPRPRLLEAPDPDNVRSWFVQVSVEDYLLNGNAVCLVTSRGFDGWPLSVAWIPAQWVTVMWTPGQPADYYVQGRALPRGDVVHVKRGADRWYPVRGVGVVEEYLGSLDRIAMEEAYERGTLSGAGVPSVAVIAPNPDLSSTEAGVAKDRWVEKFAGPRREPAILPSGTQVIPLGWSPSDNQMTEARRASLQDIANMFNLDGYWIGAPSSSMTYRSPGPMYLNLLRTSIEPVAVDIEDTWSHAWLPTTTRVRFDRQALLRDDLQTTADTLATLTGGAAVMTVNEARAYLSLPVVDGQAASVWSPIDTV
jgi:HK97 family phage portal protein